MAVDMFLKIDGIDGESNDHKHKGEIEILSFSWGLSQQTAGGGTGGSTGKVSVQDFSFVKEIDKSSPKLMEACCTGDRISDVQITLVNKETKQPYMVVKMSDCLISSYQTGGAGGGGAVPMDQVSFNFSNVEISAIDKRGQSSQVSCNFSNLPPGPVKEIGHNHGS
jgi:type VI secretion system secreted protein Hcp